MCVSVDKLNICLYDILIWFHPHSIFVLCWLETCCQWNTLKHLGKRNLPRLLSVDKCEECNWRCLWWIVSPWETPGCVLPAGSQSNDSDSDVRNPLLRLVRFTWRERLSECTSSWRSWKQDRGLVSRHHGNGCQPAVLDFDLRPVILPS